MLCVPEDLDAVGRTKSIYVMKYIVKSKEQEVHINVGSHVMQNNRPGFTEQEFCKIKVLNNSSRR